MTYLIKQWVGALAAPLALAVLFAILAVFFRWAKHAKVSRWLVVAAILIAYLGALDPVSNALLAPLERQYSSVLDDTHVPDVSYIVVLGSGYEPRQGVPLTAALDREGLVRIVEGVRLARRFTTAMLVVSGGAPTGKTPPALGYAALARSLGVSDSSLIVLSGGLDTKEETQVIAALVGTKPFMLVTSAFHMPRAMRLIERAGAHPIAAPTGQQANREVSGWHMLLPNSLGLGKSESALHEYVGLFALAAGMA